MFTVKLMKLLDEIITSVYHLMSSNFAGHFLLTNLLLDKMRDTSCISNIEGRIVNVSSEGHKLTYHEGIRFDRINDESG